MLRRHAQRFGHQRDGEDVHFGGTSGLKCLGAGLGGGARRNHIVDQYHATPANVGQLARGDAKGTADVEAPLLGGQADLSFGPPGPDKALGPDWEARALREFPSQNGGLIEAALEKSHSAQGDRNKEVRAGKQLVSGLVEPAAEQPTNVVMIAELEAVDQALQRAPVVADGSRPGVSRGACGGGG